jgi:hypothetical protein
VAGHKDGPGTSQYPGKYVSDKAKLRPSGPMKKVTPNIKTTARKTGKSK